MTKYAYGSSYYYSDGKWLPGLSVSSNPNPDLRWEKSTEFNVGLDWSVLDNRLGGSIDVYNKKTTDLLFGTQFQLLRTYSIQLWLMRVLYEIKVSKLL